MFFDENEALKYGVDESIMLSNFKFWIKKNKANRKHLYITEYNEKKIERTFTYNSARAFSELFPFWSEKQIRRILNSLIEQNVLHVDNFNKAKYDKTRWYCLIDETLLLNGNTDVTKREDGCTAG